MKEHNIRFKFRILEDLIRANKAIIFESNGVGDKSLIRPQIYQHTSSFEDGEGVSRTSYHPVLIGRLIFNREITAIERQNIGEFAFTISIWGILIIQHQLKIQEII